MGPEVTVVIPTRDRPAGLAAALAALRAQTLAADRFEVIVVDDGSAPPAGVPDPVRLLRHGASRGPAAARNTGWRAARAPLVAFTDDDCTPAPGWVEGLLAAAEEGTVVQGRVEPRAGEEAGPRTHTVAAGGPNRLFVTANVAYPRALLEALGGFDEWFRRACGEDIELGARAVASGARVRFAADALVFHEVRRLSLRDHVRQAVKWADAVRVLKLHPHLRGELAMGVFWRPSHAPFLLALAGLLARRPLLVAPYLVSLLRRGAPARLVVVDAAEVATMVAASARHRTLML
ncbi:MAG TPA: glycosyltransferase [Solirubrobacteraceae bacterium]|jgi:glycosyltransferase involved in cell wall biosynthesis